MIPVRNVYYLLCYAWDSVDEIQAVRATEVDKFHRLEDLFGVVLARGVLRVARRGLDRSYVPYEEELTGIRGKVDMSATVKQTSLIRNRIVCSFDDLSTDILHNQILASTLDVLVRHSELDPEVRREVRLALARMRGVSVQPLTRRLFARVHLDRNRRAYRFLIHVCRLLHDARLPNPESGQSRFIEVDLDRLLMWQVFERFIERFYVREQTEYRVRRQSAVHWWELETVGPGSDKRIPIMKPDVILEGQRRRIILDVKYYRDGGLGAEDTARLRSSHLYQLFAYVMNLERAASAGPCHEGILLYPTVGAETRVQYRTHGHEFQARSVDLSRPWREIHDQLLKVLA